MVSLGNEVMCQFKVQGYQLPVVGKIIENFKNTIFLSRPVMLKKM